LKGINRPSRIFYLVSILILANFSVLSCTPRKLPPASPEINTQEALTPENLPAPTQSIQHLRITNSGTTAVENLVILFPEDEVIFGDIPAGTTTEYQDVPNGVYGYAAYRHGLDGEMMVQSVTDWVGEVPLEGSSFTYTINFNPNRRQGLMVQLKEVTKDE